MTTLGELHGSGHDRPARRHRQDRATHPARNAVTYRPILPRLIMRLARHFGLDCQPFPEHVDLIVRVGRDGQRNELLRVTVNIDPNHKLCGTWPVADLNWPLRELHLNDEMEARDDNCA